MAKRVSEQEKKRMWELYQTYGSYTKVAKRLKRSPDTVSRYVHAFETGVAVAQYLTEQIPNK